MVTGQSDFRSERREATVVFNDKSIPQINVTTSHSYSESLYRLVYNALMAAVLPIEQLNDEDPFILLIINEPIVQECVEGKSKKPVEIGSALMLKNNGVSIDAIGIPKVNTLQDLQKYLQGLKKTPLFIIEPGQSSSK